MLRDNRRCDREGLSYALKYVVSQPAETLSKAEISTRFPALAKLGRGTHTRARTRTCIRGRVSWSPTLGTEAKTCQGWGTEDVVESRQTLEDPEATEQNEDGDDGHGHVGQVGGVLRVWAWTWGGCGDRQGGVSGFGGGGHR